MTLDQLLAKPFSLYALEQLRSRFMYAVTTSHLAAESAKVAVQMAFDTEVGTVVIKVSAPSPSVLDAVITTRRHYLDVDSDMRANKFLFEPALDALGTKVPDPYVNYLRRFLSSDYARYRMSATATMLCLAATT